MILRISVLAAGLTRRLSSKSAKNLSLLQNYFSASLKYHSYPVLYLKIKFKPGFLNFHVGKAKTGNLWTHFGYTSPIAWVFDLSL